MKNSDSLRLLSIGAHPADIFDQSGGTMAHHVDRGDSVACAVLTHGVRIHDKVISDEMFHLDAIPETAELSQLMDERTDIKTQEVRKACGILGVKDIYFLGMDDAVLLVERPIIKRVATLIRKIRPHIIMTHFPREGDGLTNQHAVAGQIVTHAVAFACAIDTDDRNPPHRVAQVFYFGGSAHLRRQLWDADGGYYNDVFVDISDVVQKKIESLDCLVSQGYGGAYARKRIEGNDGAMGVMGGKCPYAESFISLKAQIHRYLPVTDIQLEVAASSDHEIIQRSAFRTPVD